MPIRHLRCFIHAVVWILLGSAVPSILAAQTDSQISSPNGNRDSRIDKARRQNRWFYTGRIVRGKNAAQLHKRAHDLKLKMRIQHASAMKAGATAESNAQSSAVWTPLGPVPLASDATGNGRQNYNQVAAPLPSPSIPPTRPAILST
jgi:hypothetical protein